MNEIIISGTTGVGKSLYADGLERVAVEAGYNVEVSDHQLFTDQKNYEKRLNEVRKAHEKENADLSIIVINNGERDLQVTFVKGVSHKLACKLFIGIDSTLYDSMKENKVSD